MPLKDLISLWKAYFYFGFGVKYIMHLQPKRSIIEILLNGYG